MAMKFLNNISGPTQRKRMDAAIDESEGVAPAKPAVVAPAPAPVDPMLARKTPVKRAPGRPAKAKTGLRGLLGW